VLITPFMVLTHNSLENNHEKLQLEERAKDSNSGPLKYGEGMPGTTLRCSYHDYIFMTIIAIIITIIIIIMFIITMAFSHIVTILVTKDTDV